MKKLPEDVKWVQYMEAIARYHGQLDYPFGIGMKTYDKILAIKRKYPQHFPWQTLYDSIPESVHLAYREERDKDVPKRVPYTEREPDPDAVPGEGLWAQLERKSVAYKPGNLSMEEFRKNLYAYYDNQEKQKEERRQQDLADKELWDKHYSKYGLKYER